MSEANRLARVEAFSDGIFAIASTLLVLEIKVPLVGTQGPVRELWQALADLWPSYLAFVLSFGAILIMWVNHHQAIRMLSTTSNAFLYANGLLLLMVTFVPFPTAVLATYVETDRASAAVVFYACSSLVTNAVFLLWFAAMQKPVYLLRSAVTTKQIRKVWTQSYAGMLGYFVAAVIGWWLPLVGLGLIMALYILWTVMSVEERG